MTVSIYALLSIFQYKENFIIKFPIIFRQFNYKKILILSKSLKFLRKPWVWLWWSLLGHLKLIGFVASHYLCVLFLDCLVPCLSFAQFKTCLKSHVHSKDFFDCFFFSTFAIPLAFFMYFGTLGCLSYFLHFIFPTKLKLGFHSHSF